MIHDRMCAEKALVVINMGQQDEDRRVDRFGEEPNRFQTAL